MMKLLLIGMGVSGMAYAQAHRAHVSAMEIHHQVPAEPIENKLPMKTFPINAGLVAPVIITRNREYPDDIPNRAKRRKAERDAKKNHKR